MSNEKALVGAFNQEKVLVGAFSVIVQLRRLIVCSTTQDQESGPHPEDCLYLDLQPQCIFVAVTGIQSRG